jgi:hypothetical protein
MELQEHKSSIWESMQKHIVDNALFPQINTTLFQSSVMEK